MRAACNAFNDETFSLLLGLSAEVGLCNFLLENLSLVFAVVFVVRFSDTSLSLSTLAAQIAGVGQSDEEERENEGDPGFDMSYVARREDREDQEHPDVSPHREEGGHNEHTHIVNILRFFVHSVNRNGRDHEQVEGGGSHNSGRAELSRGVVEKLDCLKDTEHNFRG